jgi:hypothetical protein
MSETYFLVILNDLLLVVTDELFKLLLYLSVLTNVVANIFFESRSSLYSQFFKNFVELELIMRLLIV